MIFQLVRIPELEITSAIMRRQLITAGFFALFILSVQTQGRSHSGDEPCEECLTANTTTSIDTVENSQSEYSIRVHDTAANSSRPFSISLNISFDDFELQPLKHYEVTILGAHGELYSMEIRNVLRAPGEVRNLSLKSISDTTAELQWEPPRDQAGAIGWYSASLKINELLGCKNLGRTTPEQQELQHKVTDTTALFINLQPYASYTATVIAHTFVPGPSRKLEFQTNQSAIPTSVVSNLRIDRNQYSLQWDPPVDCTTISGPTPGVALFFEVISDSEQWRPIQQLATYYDYYKLSRLELAPYELHRVRAHITRAYEQPVNRTLYQELTWRTPPAEPSAVRLLEIYELDLDQNSISLRWAPPVPSNGKIISYRVSIGQKDKPLQKTWTITVPEEGVTCKQWENYVCLENAILPSHNITELNTVEVYAMNENVAKPGASSIIEFDMNSLYLLSKKAPTQPRNFGATLQSESEVSLKWEHPQNTYSKLKRFRLRFEVLNTYSNGDRAADFPMSIQYPIGQEGKEYSAELQFQNGKKYRIAVAAINQQKLSSPDALVEVEVPRVGTIVTADQMSPA